MKGLNQYIVEALKDIINENDELAKSNFSSDAIIESLNNIIGLLTPKDAEEGNAIRNFINDGENSKVTDEIIYCVNTLNNYITDVSTITKKLVEKGLAPSRSIRNVFYDKNNGDLNKKIFLSLIGKINSTNLFKPTQIKDGSCEINLKDIIRKHTENSISDSDIIKFCNALFDIKDAISGSKGVGKGEYLLRIILDDNIESTSTSLDIYVNNGNGYEVKSAEKYFSLGYGSDMNDIKFIVKSNSNITVESLNKKLKSLINDNIGLKNTFINKENDPLNEIIKLIYNQYEIFRNDHKANGLFIFKDACNVIYIDTPNNSNHKKDFINLFKFFEIKSLTSDRIYYCMNDRN